MNSDAPEGRFYWPQLDGLRATAFLLVFVSHQGPLNGMPEGQPWQLVSAVVNKVVTWGWSGVDLFYVLSGYLITTILSMERLRTGAVSFRSFFCRRALRIWPLHYWIVFLSCFVAPFWGLWGVSFSSPVWGEMMRNYAGWFALFLGNFPMAFHEAVGVSSLLAIMWSVCMEEQFYLAWGAAMRFMSRLKGIVVLLVSVLALSLCVRWWLQHGSANHYGYYYNTFSHLDPFAIGCLAALLTVRLAAVAAFVRRYAAGLVIAGLAVLLGLACRAPTIFENTAFNVPMFSILSSGWVLVLVGMLGSKAMAWPFKTRLMVHLGQRTYGLYAYHYLGIGAGTALTNSLGGHERPGLWLLRTSIGLLVTYAIAQASWWLLERRFLRMRSRHAVIKSGLDAAADVR